MIAFTCFACPGEASSTRSRRTPLTFALLIRNVQRSLWDRRRRSGRRHSVQQRRRRSGEFDEALLLSIPLLTPYAIQYSAFAVTSFFSGTINNRLGSRLTLALGAAGYALVGRARLCRRKRSLSSSYLCSTSDRSSLTTSTGAVPLSSQPELFVSRLLSHTPSHEADIAGSGHLCWNALDGSRCNDSRLRD